MGLAKQVYFNIENEQDELILNFIQDKKFTPYVKELILKDMKAQEEELGSKPLDYSYEILQAINGIATILNERTFVVNSEVVSTVSAGPSKEQQRKLDKIKKFENMNF